MRKTPTKSSSVYYIDPLDRPTQVILGSNTTSGVRSQKSFVYNDLVTVRTISTSSDLNGYGDNLLTSALVYDGLGRTTETRTGTPQGTIVSRQSYDALGRVSSSYNPTITMNEDTNGRADTIYDALSRVIRVETFDKNGGSTGALTTSYLGNQTTVTDQAGKQRRSKTDALGRLTQVDELYQSPSPDVYAATYYSYDALDNLRTVNQGAQTRTFVYDSLGRLTQATNPESGQINYQYDNNGNSEQKTDARGLITNFSYDALDRVTNRTYSNDPSLTPAVGYSYDSAAVANSKGRLTSVISSVSAYHYTEYDKLGRVKRCKQETVGVEFPMSYDYNLAGGVTREIYPSGRTIDMSYDDVCRLLQVSQGRMREWQDPDE